MKNRLIALSGLFSCLILPASADTAELVSHFPKKDTALFLADKFDLATIRSSFGPRRTTATRTFADFGMKPSKVTETELIFDTPDDWFYKLRIAGRRDFNGDGIEDLAVCFVDHAQNSGTYSTAQPLLITRYSQDSYAVALSYSVDTCKD